MEQFVVHEVEQREWRSREPVGTKEKHWISRGGTSWLCKLGRPGRGEHWAEKIAAHVGELMGVAVAHVELATVGTRFGTISRDFTEGASLALGNEVLQRIDATYPAHQVRGVRRHTVESVLEALQIVHGPRDEPGLSSGADWFVGYLLLDAVIVNTDRHHENWGILQRDEGPERLAPSYDHATSLGRELSDEERSHRLGRRDRGRTLEGYVERARSRLHDEGSERPLHPIAAFARAARLRPDVARLWLARLAGIEDDSWGEIVNAVPARVMSQVARDYALAILRHTTREALEIRP